MAHANGRRRAPGKKKPDAAKKRPTTKRTTAKPAPPVEAPPSGPFRLGAIPGATPGKWIDVWKDRMPLTPLELVPIEVAGQRAALDDETVDAALVRLPIDRAGLSVIPLYDETAVAVVAKDSHLTAADELDLADLAGEVLIVPGDDVSAVTVPGSIRPVFAPPPTTGEAIATVAAGVGVVIVPMSLARLHQRRDTEYRVLRDAPVSSVALAWPTDRTTASVEAFVGIVRGRTANSSRG